MLKEKENNLNQRISELEKDKAENQKRNILLVK
jgi:hypothetical protein